MSREGVVESLGADGEGLLRADGKIVFVADAFPGERIRYEVTETDRHFDRGKLLAVLTPSAARRESPCAHDFPGGCGGCVLLTLDPSAATAFKVTALREAIQSARLSVDALAPAVALPESLRYRNHARFVVQGDGSLAYIARSTGSSKSRGRVGIDQCPVLDPRLDALRASLVGKLRGAREVEIRIGVGTGEKMTVVAADEKPALFDPVHIESACLVEPRKGALRVLRGHPYFHEVVAGHRFRVSFEVPLRASTAGLEALVAKVHTLAGPLTPESRVLDLFAGVGVFSVGAFRTAGRVVSRETHPSAILDFRENARAHRHIFLRDGSPAEAVVDLVDNEGKFDVAFADLPRLGFDSATIAALLRLPPTRLILATGDQKTLLRDLPHFLAAGYRLDTLVPFDLLPGTAALEMVVVLSR